MIETHSYTPEQLSPRRSLFSVQIENDPWILYHATTSQIEQVIDSQGFAGRSTIVTAEHIAQLIDIYRRMNWGGIPGGYSNLASFTLGRSQIDKPQTWFRETSLRSLIYSTSQFAGGEWMMSFRQSFKDLMAFAKSEQVRQEHLEYQVSEFKYLVERGARPTPVIRVEVGAMLRELEALQNVYEACEEFVSEYKHGLVYAVKFENSDISGLSNGGNSGILYTGELPANRIAGKAILHFCQSDVLQTERIVFNCSQSQLENILRWPNSELAAAIGGNPPPTPTLLTRDSTQREWIGKDISGEIVGDRPE